MQLEDYFDFQGPDDIRIKGTRVGIETVLDDYLHQDKTAEYIQQTYPSLTLEQVYATILYYHRNQEQVQEYMADYIFYCHQSEKSFQSGPVTERLRNIYQELKTFPPEERLTVMHKIIEQHRAQLLSQEESQLEAPSDVT
ncbi:MAG: DUF433 domain-containing protein [Gemmatimonadaceae bacterium]|nr:DUF433 domain-containing protein [Gloeobacterales cyanobacterium ES-bin-141]